MGFSGMKNKITEFVARKVRKRFYHNRFQKKMQNAAFDIQPLNAQEKEKIKTFWGQFGIAPDMLQMEWLNNIFGVRDHRYVTQDVYANYLLPHLSNLEGCKGLSDKNMFDVLFAGANTPEVYFRKVQGVLFSRDYQVIDLETALQTVQHEEKVVIKLSVDTKQGEGVQCVSVNELEQVIAQYGKNFVVQKVIHQHLCFAVLNDSSVNIVRLTSMLLPDGVHILDSIVRIGKSGAFTDQHNVSVGLDDQGMFRDFGTDIKGNRVYELPNGFAFKGHGIVAYDEMKRLAVEMHGRVAQGGIIGWDFTVNEEGCVVLIEANFGHPGCIRGQECNGPLFGEKTEEIVRAIMSR